MPCAAGDRDGERQFAGFGGQGADGERPLEGEGVLFSHGRQAPTARAVTSVTTAAPAATPDAGCRKAPIAGPPGFAHRHERTDESRRRTKASSARDVTILGSTALSAVPDSERGATRTRRLRRSGAEGLFAGLGSSVAQEPVPRGAATKPGQASPSVSAKAERCSAARSASGAARRPKRTSDPPNVPTRASGRPSACAAATSAAASSDAAAIR